jgi:hypothetical protein
MPNSETDPSMEEEAAAVISALDKIARCTQHGAKSRKTFQRYSDWLDAHDSCGKSLPLSPTRRARDDQSVTTVEELRHGLKLAADPSVGGLRRGHPHWTGHKPLTYQFDVPAHVVLLV